MKLRKICFGGRKPKIQPKIFVIIVDQVIQFVKKLINLVADFWQKRGTNAKVTVLRNLLTVHIPCRRRTYFKKIFLGEWLLNKKGKVCGG